MVFDKNTNEVKIGSWVKVLYEEKILKAMINKTYEVIDIEHGKAIVHLSFDEGHGFSLALTSEEMELVDKN